VAIQEIFIVIERNCVRVDWMREREGTDFDLRTSDFMEHGVTLCLEGNSGLWCFLIYSLL